MEFFIEKTLKGDGSNSYVLVNQDMEIIEEVALFLQDLERRNLAPNTVKLYCRNLKKFYEWVNKKKLNIFETSIKELIYFTDYLREQNLSPESINNINATVKSFYQFFYQIGGYYVPLFDKNQTIYKVERQRPKSFFQHSDLLTLKTRSKQKDKRLYPRDLEELERAIKLLYKEEPLQFRNLLMFKLLYSTGLRVGECLNLRIYDFSEPEMDKSFGYLKVIQHSFQYHIDHSIKTLEREIPIRMSLINELDEYIQRFRPSNAQVDTIFVNHRGTNKGSYMKRASVEKFFNKLSTYTGIKCTPHMLRHTFASLLKESGVMDDLYISKLLGHSSVTTTSDIYTHIDLNTLTASYEHFIKNMKGMGF